jgi:iron(III) transport system ATP-binding protein
LKLTVAYVTHDQAEALAVSDQIIVMDQGLVAQAGTPHALYERPTSAFVAGFMGEALLFDGESLADGSVRLGPLSIRPAQPLPPGPVKVAVRPEAWEVGPAGAGALAATLAKSAYLGSTHEYTFETELGAVFVVSPDVSRLLAPGEHMSLALAGHGVSVVPA